MSKKKGSVVNVIEGIVIAVLILVIAVMLFLYFSFSKTGAAPEVFGYTIYRTMAVNMAPEIPANTAVIAQASEIENIKVGSVVLCRIGEDTVLTRVVQLVSENGEMSYVVKFDTDPPNNTFKLPSEHIIAKAVWQSGFLGKLLNFATSTAGIMLVIIIPSFIIIVFQIVRIINAKRAEEEASSLEDLDEIMITDDDDRFEDMFSSDIEEKQLRPIAVRNEPIEKPSVLSVDKNGKAGLTAVADDNAPLFTYENFGKNDNEPSKPAVKKGTSVVKPIKTPDTDNFYASYVSDEERDPLYGNRIKRQEIIEDDAGQTDVPKKLFSQQQEEFAQQSEAPAETAPAFMSNVLPKAITDATTASEKHETAPSEPVRAYEPKKVRADQVIQKSPNIPPQAIIPKERLSPPPKKSNSKAISELMNIIDAEESKLRK